MTSLKDEAKAYEPPQTLNIADLEKASIDMDLQTAMGNEGTKDKFKYKFIVVEGKKYRVPGVVLGYIKALLKRMPDLKYVSVLKEGTGLQTKYQVIPNQEIKYRQPGETVIN